MLRSYDFFELSDIGEGIRDKGIFDEEIQIIKEISEGFPASEKASTCSACGCEDITEFFQIWGRAYYRCQKCKTVFMNPDLESLISLNSDKRLIAFRKSECYQSDAEKRRSLLWDELIFWLKYKLYRYLGRCEGLSITDFGSRFDALSERLIASGICKNYETRETLIIKRSGSEKIAEADAVLYLDHIQKYKNPAAKLIKLRNGLKDGGLLFLSARTGTGLDILTMKGGITNIMPYEHVTLLSIKGLNAVLNRAGYEVLEITTPGVMDVKYLMDNFDTIPRDQEFIKFMLESSDETTLSEFQRFLQKNQLSSYAQIVVRKRGGAI